MQTESGVPPLQVRRLYDLAPDGSIGALLALVVGSVESAASLHEYVRALIPT